METAAQEPKLLDRLRSTIRLKHYSYRTEQTYMQWVRRFILFHNKRHPRDMGGVEILEFLNHLATDKYVSASTQNQAMCAIVFLYKNILNIDPGEFNTSPTFTMKDFKAVPQDWRNTIPEYIKDYVPLNQFMA